MSQVGVTTQRVMATKSSLMATEDKSIYLWMDDFKTILPISMLNKLYFFCYYSYLNIFFYPSTIYDGVTKNLKYQVYKIPKTFY